LTAKNRVELCKRDATEIAEDCPACSQRLPEGKLAELKVKQSISRDQKTNYTMANGTVLQGNTVISNFSL
jgi:hypothetical protein